MLSISIDITSHFCNSFPKPCHLSECGKPKNSYERPLTAWDRGNDRNPVPGFNAAELLLVVDADL